jgi:hypothetical protein
MTGRVAGAVAMLAALSGVTACGPAPKLVAALTYAGGKPTALLVNCPDFKINSMYVDAIAAPSRTTWIARGPGRAGPSQAGPGQTGPGQAESGQAESGQAESGQAGPAQITLLQAPAGWTVEEQTLTSFDVAGKYEAQPFSSTNRSGNVVAFTIDQLKALKPGQVLVNKARNEPLIISEEKFRKDAEAAC